MYHQGIDVLALGSKEEKTQKMNFLFLIIK